ncbi:hypothetical protein GMA12_16730 [Kocuria sediminis]|uniref:Uncharacterized protein n=1 Tax=Kocuria sediminis TaxID=1038857 RepID=A0A6N8GV07_9MICC|nr:hypothetical protein [Kocuria sediminis]MUN64765.1 hypothetical protein [Kocuria sediminis]
MKKTSAVMGAALTGVVGGVAVAFLLCVATAAVALANGSSASLPGLFSAWAGTENGAFAVEFQPNAIGLLVVVGVCALLSAALTARKREDPLGAEGSH